MDQIDELWNKENLPFVWPPRDGSPSDIAVDPAKWIQDYGDVIGLRNYWIRKQIDPNNPDAMANVSNRGLTGAGEKTFIAGFIVTGGQARNLVVRALGPSLTTDGIRQVAANPKLEVYQGFFAGKRHAQPWLQDWDTTRGMRENFCPQISQSNTVFFDGRTGQRAWHSAS